MKYCCFDMDRITVMFGRTRAFRGLLGCAKKINTEREIHKATVEDNDVIKIIAKWHEHGS